MKYKIYKIIYNDRVIYVGKTTKKPSYRKTYKCIDKETLDQSEFQVIEETDTPSRERYWIEYYRSINEPLRNVYKGYGLTKEDRLKLKKDWHSRNKEKTKEYYKTNYGKNKEKNKEKNKMYRLKNKEYYKAYYEKHKEKMKEYYKIYHQKNKEYSHDYYIKNKEKMNQYSKDYYEKHKMKNDRQQESDYIIKRRQTIHIIP